MSKTWLWLSAVVGLVLVLAAPVCTDSQAGKEAYRHGDFETAVKELQPLADKGMRWPNST